MPRATYSKVPQNIDGGTWYYEDTRGLLFVRYHADVSGPEEFRIPWKLIEATMKRRAAVRRASAKRKR